MINKAALIFDLDQTLFDRQFAVDNWFASLRLSHCDQARLRLLDRNGYGDREDYFVEFESLTGNKMDHKIFISSLVRFLEPDRSLINCLKRLRTYYSIAILTNGGAWTQHAKIKALSLNEVFPQNCIFVSEEIGFEKPDTNAFNYVANSLGVPASECLYFGDSMPTDIIAARVAGWRACHISGPAELARLLVQLPEVVTC
ncbi:HAD family hydrolase [Rubinisphaera sp.]|uniref:HAD family hydrolase n=1 Tax=Rubinisphaera sp. TaxID=2024857 RepID=UPI000C0C7452|nr:HAD family hydrolase [Rubinisphaera sp.]MBV11904.1 hypothetical protein [Rubinisphaera sp.]HCS51542.1 hypothetical protein [Planctomycetaceae bacterium]